ncbi:MAG: hypothetical protein JWO77_52 [Ilumatobacteraceae bacterium]|nr:hypothetical protein [Ilumatobacteraceae bacterium]
MTPTATPDAAPPTRAWRWAVPVLAVLVAVVAGAVTLAGSGEDAGSRRSAPATPPTEVAADAVEVTSDAPAYTSLQELVDASDLVVRGRITAAERGRWFGEPGAGRIQSRLLTLDVDEILSGSPEGEVASLLVEEGGWTEDGRPLVIDGAVPSQEGDEGIWFLTATGDETTGAWIVVNAQGRYRVGEDGLEGAKGGDPLVADLTSGSLDDLEARISRTRPHP